MQWRAARESVAQAVSALRGNPLRSVLSLTGITVGIFCLITIFASVDSLQRNLRASIESLGGEVVFVQKWPWTFSADYPWWTYIDRPVVSLDDYRALKGTVALAEEVAFWTFVDVVRATNERSRTNDVYLFGVSEGYEQVRELNFAQGRFFRESELYTGSDVAILGADVARALYRDGESALDRTIRVDGRTLRVIGVFEREGEDLLGLNAGFGLDNTIYVPIRQAVARFTDGGFDSDPFILVKARPGVDLDELRYELLGRMRQIRRLDPRDDPDFALNTISMLTTLFAPFFATLNIAGLVIGAFSIAVGIFGIAIILFVSVKERTVLIGVKKALGARRSAILIEFLAEGAILALLGGVIGLVLVLGVITGLNAFFDNGDGTNFRFYLSGFNIGLGLGLSIVSGLVAGILPAWTAARLDPVVAMRG